MSSKLSSIRFEFKLDLSFFIGLSLPCLLKEPASFRKTVRHFLLSNEPADVGIPFAQFILTVDGYLIIEFILCR